MTDTGPRSIDEVIRENRILQRRLRRLESDIRQLEGFQDSNATLLSGLLRDLEAERAKSHRLLLNVLPQRIIDRLAAGETRIADGHDDVTVLFSDVVGFTAISARLAPAALVEELDELVSGFDAICEATGVDKIKTVGDAYLAVGGLGATTAEQGDALRGTGERAVAEAALRMCAFAGEPDRAGGWQIRIGLHAGPIVAGVVGTSKFAYDVWGDTVNIASRLETSSEPGRIHLSADLARRLDGEFLVERRGVIDLKGKGATETFWLVGRR
jgi:adenylate cyclase